jgi:hypothetical protein
VFEGAVRAAVVVFVAEGVEEGLELGDGGRLVGLGAEPFLFIAFVRRFLPQPFQA